RALVTSVNPETTQRLMDRINLDSPNEKHSWHIMGTLGERRDPKALPKLIEIWSSHHAPNMRRNAGMAIIDLGDKLGLEAMAAKIWEADLDMRCLAIKGTFKMGPEAAYERLAPYFDPRLSMKLNGGQITTNTLEVLGDILDDYRFRSDYSTNQQWIDRCHSLLMDRVSMMNPERFISVYHWKRKENSLFGALIEAAQYFKADQEKLSFAMIGLLDLFN